jgi:hypothetical protein
MVVFVNCCSPTGEPSRLTAFLHILIQHNELINRNTNEEIFAWPKIHTCATIANNHKLEAWIINSLLIWQSLHQLLINIIKKKIKTKSWDYCNIENEK